MSIAIIIIKNITGAKLIFFAQLLIFKIHIWIFVFELHGNAFTHCTGAITSVRITTYTLNAEYVAFLNIPNHCFFFFIVILFWQITCNYQRFSLLFS